MPHIIWEHRGFRIVKRDNGQLVVEEQIRDAMGEAGWHVRHRVDTTQEWSEELMRWVEQTFKREAKS